MAHSPPTTAPILREINLQRGWPFPALLPIPHILRASCEVFSNQTAGLLALQYGPSKGHLPLRLGIASWLSNFYTASKRIPTSRICITGGASQSFVSILQQFSDPRWTRRVWMVAPTYFLACQMLEDAGFKGKLRAVPEDSEGIDLGFLRQELIKTSRLYNDHQQQPNFSSKHKVQKKYRHLIYAVPTFSNPSSRTMSLRRRESLVRVAREFDALIISDDVYDFLQWTKSPNLVNELREACLPRIVDVDRHLDGGSEREGSDLFGNAVSNGSFSKLLGPGCRTGWVEGTEAFVDLLSQVGSTTSGGASSQLAAACISQIIDDGGLQSHIKNSLAPAYSARYETLHLAIDKYLRPLNVTVVENDGIFGGFFVWLTLPANVDADLVAQKSRLEQNLIVASGSLFEVWGDEESARFPNNIRLCFAWESEGHLVEGVQRLSSVIRSIVSADGG